MSDPGWHFGIMWNLSHFFVFSAKCSNETKCRENEGDCREDSDCLPGLKCGKTTDACTQNPLSGTHSDIGCCYKRRFWLLGYMSVLLTSDHFSATCSNENRCAAGDGECYQDSDCLDSHRCGTSPDPNCTNIHPAVSASTATCCYQC